MMVFSVSLTGQQDSIASLTEDEIECSIKPLQIAQFKIVDKREKKKFQIVAGHPIDYSAIHGDDTSPFIWHLSKELTNPQIEFEFILEGINPTTMVRKGTANITAAILNQFDSNQYFGPTTLFADNDLGGMDEKEVKIFFEKEAMHPITGNPNWFDYWQDNNLVSGVLTSINKSKTFNISTCMWETNTGVLDLNFQLNLSFHYTELYPNEFDYIIEGTYGAHQTIIGQPIEIGEYSEHGFCTDLYPFKVIVNQSQPHINIWLGPGASRKKGASFREPLTLKGIDTYYSTLVHEVEHARIFFDNWGDGFISILDDDDDDYRDVWENLANIEMDQSTFVVKPYGRFNDNQFGPDDTYDPNYNSQILFQNPPKHSAGTEYEEWRCRRVEYFIEWLFPLLKVKDWSYDPPVNNNMDPRNRTQGKQW